MKFKDAQPIYAQIAERLSDEVLSGTYPPQGRVPGVREYAALLGVNVNTVVKAYDYLAADGVIQSQRGMGYYVTPEARQLIGEARRSYFRTRTLPDFFRQMRLLGISMDEVLEAYGKQQDK